MSLGFAPASQKRRQVEPPALAPQIDGCVYSEFRKSAIPDWYTEGAIEYYAGGRTLVQVLTANVLTGRNGSHQGNDYLTKHDAWWVRLYEEACSNGGWLLKQATLTGCPEPNPYIKLNTPRRNREGKIVKYEGAAKGIAAPLLLPVTWGMGLKRLNRFCPLRVRTEYQQRFEASGAGEGDFDEGWWDFVEENPCVPLCIAEGGKKGASLEVRDYSSVVLRGVNNFFRKRQLRTDSFVPHEVCSRLFVKGRPVVIVPDFDEKPRTVKRVKEALDRMGQWLTERGCKVALASWDEELGKGIDDVLYAIGSEKGEDAARQWLSETIESAKSYKAWKRSNRIEKALAKIYRLNNLSFQVERATEGEYLPQLPTLSPGAIHVLDGTMNSGKTVRIGADWVKSSIAAGWRVLVLSPLNSLGKQTAGDWDLPHIHDYKTDRDSQNALWTDVSHRGGIVMCYDSLHRLPQWFFEGDGRPRPILLVLDEAGQGIGHLTGGGTLGSRWGEIVGRFAAMASHASQYGAIVLSEDGIGDRAVEFVRSVAGAGHGAVASNGPSSGHGAVASNGPSSGHGAVASNGPSSGHGGENIPVRVFQHRKKSQPWDVTLYEGNASGYRRNLVLAMLEVSEGRSKPLLVATSSKEEGERLERETQKRCPFLKIIRIDSDTNEGGAFREFFSHPDRWLQEHRPDILSISPSAKSGVSIEGGVDLESAYFGSVWGYFSCGATDTHLQLLGRYRPPVPRHIFIPPLIQSSSDEALGSSWAVAARLKANARGLARAIELDDTDIDAVANDTDIASTTRELEIERAALEYVSQALTVSGAGKSIAAYALVERLERAGHRISVERAPTDKEIAASWRETQDEIWHDRAREAARLKIDPEVHTKDWARQQLQKLEVGREMRTLAHKVLWRFEFPGIAFDDEGECYEAIYRDYGRMKRGVKMQAMAEMPDRAKFSDGAAIASILKGNIRALHRLPKNAAKAMLLAHLGILELLDGESYSNTDSRAVSVKEKALSFASEIRYWLNLNVNDGQTPVEICHKLLARFGFEIERKNRPGAIEIVGRPGKRRESRDRIYRVNANFNPTRTRLLEAYRRQLSEASNELVSAISNQENTDIEIADTNPKTPENTKSAGDLEGVLSMHSRVRLRRTSTSRGDGGTYRRFFPR